MAFELPQGEGVGTDGHGLAGAESGNTHTHPLQRVIDEAAVAAGDLDAACFALEENLKLGGILKIEGGGCETAERASIRTGVGAVEFRDQGRQEQRPSPGNTAAFITPFSWMFCLTSAPAQFFYMLQ